MNSLIFLQYTYLHTPKKLIRGSEKANNLANHKTSAIGETIPWHIPNVPAEWQCPDYGHGKIRHWVYSGLQQNGSGTAKAPVEWYCLQLGSQRQDSGYT